MITVNGGGFIVGQFKDNPEIPCPAEGYGEHWFVYHIGTGALIVTPLRAVAIDKLVDQLENKGHDLPEPWSGYRREWPCGTIQQVEDRGSQLWLVEYRYSKTLAVYHESTARLLHSDQAARSWFYGHEEATR